MLIKHFSDFISICNGSYPLLVLDKPSEVDEIVSLFHKSFQGFSKNNIKEGANYLREIARLFNEKKYLFQKVSFFINSIENQDGLDLDKYKNAKSFWFSTLGVVSQPCYLNIMNDKERMMQQMSFLAKTIINEYKNGQLPVYSNSEKLDEVIAVREVICNDDFLPFLLSCPQINSEMSNLNKLDENASRMLTLKFVQSLLKKEIITLDELLGISGRYDEFLKNQDSINSSGFEEIFNSAEISLTKDKLSALLLNVFNNKNIPIAKTIYLLNIAAQVAGTDEVDNLILLVKDKSWEVIKENIAQLVANAHIKKYPERSIYELMSEFLVPNEIVKFPLDLSEFQSIYNKYKIVNSFAESLPRYESLTPLLEETKKQLRENVNPEEAKLKILAIIREQIKRNLHIFPYNLQVINVLALLNSDNNRRIAQIKTGEGKSTIIAMLAAYKAITESQKIDIITTARDLAVRDAEKHKTLFQSLGLSVGHNAIDSKSEELYLPDIVYGTSYDFEFTYLEEETYGSKLREGIRPYAQVIVDEVDSMFLDMQRNAARLACKSKNAALYRNVYQFIWKYIDNSQSIVFNDFVMSLRVELQNTPLRNLEEEQFRKQAKRWWDAAKSAILYQEGKEYIVSNGKIKIVDFMHTGQVSETSRWNNGLHSLLEVKHGLEVKSEDLTIASISHIDYFNKYDSIYGLTGTLGNESDRAELVTLYNISYYDSPTYRKSQKKLVPHLVTEGNEMRNEAIQETVRSLVDEGRAVLIICETITESEELYFLLKDCSGCVQKYNAVQDDSTDTILTLAGTSRAITIATNTAGRGADISITAQVEEKGGLHVIITFPTINSRVEEQGFGRTGRQGKPGTYQYILDIEELGSYMQEEEILSDEIIESWQQARTIDNQQLTKIRAKERVVFSLINNVQHFFFSLPDDFKQKIAATWAECFSRIDVFAHEINFNASRISELEKVIASEITYFFDTFNYHHTDLYPTPLHYCVFINNSDLAKLLVDSYPNMSTIRNQDGKLAHQLTENLELKKIVRPPCKHMVNQAARFLVASMHPDSSSNNIEEKSSECHNVERSMG